MRLNLGSGTTPIPGWVNVDLYGRPDVRLDLDAGVLPWPDGSVDEILASHVLEHLRDWWPLFLECARVLRLGGTLEVRVPDHTNTSALTPRDHYHVFSIETFHGVSSTLHPMCAGRSAWAAETERTLPLVLYRYTRTPYDQYRRLAKWLPRVFAWLAYHGTNFVWDQRFHFRKIGGGDEH